MLTTNVHGKRGSRFRDVRVHIGHSHGVAECRRQCARGDLPDLFIFAGQNGVASAGSSSTVPFQPDEFPCRTVLLRSDDGVPADEGVLALRRRQHAEARVDRGV